MGYRDGDAVTDRSVGDGQFGRFLIEIFDQWVGRDAGKMFVLNFDGALAGRPGMAGTVRIFGPTCGLGLPWSITATFIPVTTVSNRTTARAIF